MQAVNAFYNLLQADFPFGVAPAIMMASVIGPLPSRGAVSSPLLEGPHGVKVGVVSAIARDDIDHEDQV